MGLDEFSPDDNQENSSSAREYTQITEEEFEEFLQERYMWTYVGEGGDMEHGLAKENVYSIPLDHEDLNVRIFSTITGGRARDKGDDAIRAVIWSKSQNRPVGGRRKTLRITTWRKNLGDKIDSLLREWEDVVDQCEECGNWMVKREGKFGEFLGCLGYPDCENTRQIDE